MSDPHEVPAQEPPSWIGRVKAGLVWIFRKIGDHIFGIVLVAATALIIGFVWPKTVDVQLGQSGWGEHCPEQVWAAAENVGAELQFEPESVRQIAICGPGKYPTGDPIEALVSYLFTYQPPCFQTKMEGNMFTIRPNLDKQALAHDRQGKDSFFTCRCLQDQAELMFRHRGDICGLPTPRVVPD